MPLVSLHATMDDVRLILSIPLSKTGCRDQMVWHHNANGVYSVRSGYGVAMNLMENGALGKKGCGSASDKPKNCSAWNLIWKLKRTHMRVDNVCGVCGAMDKTEAHLFFRCHLNHLF
ncbi:hypothetical protein ACFX2K_029686 [Malus domestica]